MFFFSLCATTTNYTETIKCQLKIFPWKCPHCYNIGRFYFDIFLVFLLIIQIMPKCMYRLEDFNDMPGCRLSVIAVVVVLFCLCYVFICLHPLLIKCTLHKRVVVATPYAQRQCNCYSKLQTWHILLPTSVR